MLNHQRATLLKWRREFCFALVLFKVTGNVCDQSDEYSSEDDGEGFHAYLEVQFFDWAAVESMGAVAIQLIDSSPLAYSEGPLSDGKDTDEEGFSGL